MKQIALLIYIFGTVVVSHTQTAIDTQSANYSPLHWAAAQGYVEMMQVLVDKGYDINTQDANGFTPLHYAAAIGSFNGVEFLVNRGADVYLANNRNMTPMTLAAQAGEQKIVDYLFVKMRSMRVAQLREQSEKQRINTDLVQAAKARAEAERLRQQASEWTKEAEYWRAEAGKWTKEANELKNQQIQLDQMATERYNQIITEKMAAENNFKSERLARTAAERLLREQSANTKAQIRAYEAQVAALAAQRATDAAIENLAEEFIKQGMSNPQHFGTETNNADYISVDPNLIPIQIMEDAPAPNNNYSLELTEIQNPPKVLSNSSSQPVPETPVEDTTEEEIATDEGTENTETVEGDAAYYDDYSYAEEGTEEPVAE